MRGRRSSLVGGRKKKKESPRRSQRTQREESKKLKPQGPMDARASRCHRGLPRAFGALWSRLGRASESLTASFSNEHPPQFKIQNSKFIIPPLSSARPFASPHPSGFWKAPLSCHCDAGESQWKQSIPGAPSTSLLLSAQNSSFRPPGHQSQRPHAYSCFRRVPSR
jgi:hypothetical protein